VVIKVWIVPEGKLLTTLVGHNSGLSEIIFSPNSRYLISASSDGRLKFWELENGKLIWEWKDLKVPVKNLAMQLDRTLQFYRYGFSLNRLISCPVPNAIALSPNGHILSVGLTNGEVYLWNLMRSK